MKARLSFRGFAALPLIVVVCICLSACSASSAKKSQNSVSSSSSSSQESDDSSDINVSTEGLGEKEAGSFKQFFADLLKQDFGTPSEEEKRVLTQAAKTGLIPTSEYENAWAGYKQCMLDRGYQQIIIEKFPNGVMQEAPLETVDSVTPEQRSKYSSDMSDCQNNWNLIMSGYEEQIANKNLYANKSEAIVDCLHQQKAVPDSFTLKDYVKAVSSGGNAKKYGLNRNSPKVRGCEAGNQTYYSDENSVYEFPWGCGLQDGKRPKDCHIGSSDSSQ
jgi:hypothetical protein